MIDSHCTNRSHIITGVHNIKVNLNNTECHTLTGSYNIILSEHITGSLNKTKKLQYHRESYYRSVRQCHRKLQHYRHSQGMQGCILPNRGVTISQGITTSQWVIISQKVAILQEVTILKEVTIQEVSIYQWVTI